MEQRSRKIPVTEREFLWVQDDDKGEVTLHVGPTMVSPTAADRVVVDDGLGGLQEDTTGKPQSMIELGDAQYAVMFNPLLENDGGPNGRFRPGRNESRPLRNGTRSMVPGPCSFYVRPGQRADVRDAHELASNQYLVVKVYGEVDKSAPYYEVTARSAGILRATGEKDTPPPAREPVELRRGQLIVIRGLDTQFYIPPSGVDIVPDTSVDDSGAAMSAAAARQLLAQAGEELADEEDVAEGQMARGTPRPQMANAYVDQSARVRHRKMPPPPPAARVEARPVQPAVAASAAAAVAASAPMPQEAADVLVSATVRRALERQARQTRLIRNAVVLAEKEYCVIVDADGKRQIKVGPARVFPGPYDTFMTAGSRNRIYDAYELLPQRALWLRVIASISRAELADKLPRGVALDKDEYHPGDEILLTGVSTFFVPFNEIEILSPESGLAVVGNDHSKVFIEAIGIDQKSGIYVRDLTTGEVRLVRGKQSYLVDPRKEVQITRTVPADDWNLWIAANEPHKLTAVPVTTPWAVSITVPNNTAVLITSANDRRVVEGPCVTLLGYEETLYPVLLSTGTPKSDQDPLRTCFLRTVGNRVSDEIAIETADFVRVAIRVSYSVTFTTAQRDRWFNHENYIQIMVDHLRSIVRGRCRTVTLMALWPQLPNVLRDTILGEHKDGPRPGRQFVENGTAVTEVEVLSATIVDKVVAELLQRVQTESVTLQIGDRQVQAALLSAKLRADVEREQQALHEEARRLAARLAELTENLAHEMGLAKVRHQELVAREQQALADQRDAAALDAKNARLRADLEAEILRVVEDARARSDAMRMVDAAEVEKAERLRHLELSLIAAQAEATVAERKAVQQGLIEALTALGDKIVLGEVAQNMNLVSLFKGRDVATLLAEVVRGTKLDKTLQGMISQDESESPV